MKQKEKRILQIVAVFATIIGVTLVMITLNISNVFPIYISMILVILGTMFYYIGAISYAILKYYY
jgi:hypothetical protein